MMFDTAGTVLHFVVLGKEGWAAMACVALARMAGAAFTGCRALRGDEHGAFCLSFFI